MVLLVFVLDIAVDYMAESAENCVLKRVIRDLILDNIAVCELQSLKTECLHSY